MYTNKSPLCNLSMFPHHLPSISLWIHPMKARWVLKNCTCLWIQTYPNHQVPRKPWPVDHYGAIAYLLAIGISFPIVLHPYHLLHVRDWMCTGANRFGLLCEYSDRPSYDPDSAVQAEDLSDYYKSRKSNTQPELPPNISWPPPPWPYKNLSTYLLIDWMMMGSSLKSIGEVNHLVRCVINAKNISVDDLGTFNAQQELHSLDKSAHSECAASSPFSGDGWTKHDVLISVPNGTKGSSGDNFIIPGLYRCPLSAVLKSALSDTMSLHFHFSPFKRFWWSPSGLEQWCYDEAYTSDAWLKYHNELQLQPNELGCKLEKVVLGLMFWSDSTHLTSFGTAKVWPLYMYIGNLSKHFRNKLSSGACHHVAYIPSVSLFGILLSINWLFWY